MMHGRLGLRRRMALTAVLASGVALLVVLLFVQRPLHTRALEREREARLAEARLMARVVADALVAGVDSDHLDPQIDAAAREVKARVTIIEPDGRVVADSAVSGADLAALPNHSNRPEIRQAFAKGWGTSVRFSATVHRRLLYCAVRIESGGKVVGVSRVSAPLTDIEAQGTELLQAVGLALLLAFAITAALSAALSSSLVGPLHRIMDTARRLGAGDLSARIPLERRDELGELARIINEAADELQSRMTELDRTRARTDAILAAMEEGVLAVDHKGHVVLANDVLRRSFDLVDPVGRHYLEAVRQTEVGAVIEAVLASGDRHTAEVEVPSRRRVFALTGVPYPAGDNAPHGAVLTFHDITERRRLDRVRRDFVANASHELRTPLTSVRGFVEALEDGAANDPTLSARFLGKIHAHADRMTALVEDLLELSRIESGDREPVFERVPPMEVVDDVVASLAAIAQRKGITLEKRDSGVSEVVTDVERMRRILENLVDNAVKYTQEGGRVELEASPREGGGVVITVRDNGPGIAADHLPRLFERFYRVDKARSRELGGTGLGLAIVRHLAESIGASVDVTSELERGSTFTVHIPAGQTVRAEGA
jgi:two-component system phosphate regulon sensor histidine kinase PhoR